MSTRDELTRRLSDVLASEQAAAVGAPEELTPAVDLASLLGEMAALKSEVRAETRSARDVRDQAKAQATLLAEEHDRALKREEALRAELSRERRESRRRAARTLIDLADRLEASLRSAEKLAEKRGFWPWSRPAPAAAALAEGLRLTQARLQGALTDLGVDRVGAEGQRWDGATMEVVDTAVRPEVPEGNVVEVVTAGYVDAEGVIRFAQVVANRKED